MGYCLKGKRLSLDDKRNDMLHMYLDATYTAINDENASVFNKDVADYTPFGRVLFGLLAELTSTYFTSDAYVKEKVRVLFDEY